MRSCNKIFTITEYSGFTREIKVQVIRGFQKKHSMHLKLLFLLILMIVQQRL